MVNTLGEGIPGFAEGWNKRATLYSHLGRYAESSADFNEVIRLNPHHFGALAGLGQNYIRLDDRAKALDCFEPALAINPDMQGVAVNIMGLRKLITEKAGRAI